MTQKSKSSEPVIFKEFNKSETQKLRIWKSIYKGSELYSIQTFWRETPQDEWQYGKATTFHPEMIDDIIDGLEKMKQWWENNA